MCDTKLLEKFNEYYCIKDEIMELSRKLPENTLNKVLCDLTKTILKYNGQREHQWQFVSSYSKGTITTILVINQPTYGFNQCMLTWFPTLQIFSTLKFPSQSDCTTKTLEYWRNLSTICQFLRLLRNVIFKVTNKPFRIHLSLRLPPKNRFMS